MAESESRREQGPPQLMARLKNYSPGPWKACRDGECSCGFIWSTPADHPVAKVESGEWGDDYPAVRIVPSEHSLTGTSFEVTAYMEQIGYGQIDPEVAQQNARLIALSPEMFELLQLGLTLQTEKEYLQWRVLAQRLLRE